MFLLAYRNIDDIQERVSQILCNHCSKTMEHDYFHLGLSVHFVTI